MPGLKNKVQSAKLLANGQALASTASDDGLVVSLPAEATDQYVSVVVLKVDGVLEVTANLPTLGKNGRLLLTSDRAFIHNNEGSQNAEVRTKDGVAHIGLWTDKEAFVEWTFDVKETGEYKLEAVCSIEAKSSKLTFGIAGGESTTVELKSTGSYDKYKSQRLGAVKFEKAGNVTLRIKPDLEGWKPVNLQNVELIRK